MITKADEKRILDNLLRNQDFKEHLEQLQKIEVDLSEGQGPRRARSYHLSKLNEMIRQAEREWIEKGGSR